MIRGELDLEIGKFNAKIDAAVNKTNQAKTQMRSASAGMSEGLASRLVGNVGGDLAGTLGIGTGAVGTIIAAGVAYKSLLSNVDDLADRSTALREMPETMQRVEHAAKNSGSTFEKLRDSVLKLEQNLGDIGNTGAREALERYGLTTRSLMAMPLDQKILAIADAYRQARDSGGGYADLQDLLGKGSKDLIPLLEQSREELEGLFNGVNVLSNAAVVEMAAANDRIDTVLTNWSNGSKRAAYDFMNLFDVLVAVGKNSSWTDAFASIQEREAVIVAKMQDLQRQKQEQAEGLAAAQEAADAAAAKKKADEQAKKEDKGLSDARDKVDQRKLAGVEGPDRLAALGEELKKVFDAMHQKGGLFFDKTTEGLAKWVAALDKAGNKELATEALKMQEKALQIQQEMDKLADDMRDKAAQEGKKKQDDLDRLREQSAEKSQKLLSPKEQAAELRAQLAQSFGLKVNTAEDVTKGLDKLARDVNAKKDAGDVDGELEARKRYNEALDQAQQLAGLSQGGGSRASVAGETAGAIGILTGRGSDLVLDESKRQSQTLERIRAVLENIERNGGRETADGGVPGFDDF